MSRFVSKRKKSIVFGTEGLGHKVDFSIQECAVTGPVQRARLRKKDWHSYARRANLTHVDREFG